MFIENIFQQNTNDCNNNIMIHALQLEAYLVMKT